MTDERADLEAALEPLQEWEGCVTGVGDENFVAELVDLTAGDCLANEEATIALREISDADRAKLGMGSRFRWVIGYERLPTGVRRSVSRFVFADPPVVTAADLRRGKAWADRMLEWFKSDEPIECDPSNSAS